MSEFLLTEKVTVQQPKPKKQPKTENGGNNDIAVMIQLLNFAIQAVLLPKYPHAKYFLQKNNAGITEDLKSGSNVYAYLQNCGDFTELVFNLENKTVKLFKSVCEDISFTANAETETEPNIKNSEYQDDSLDDLPEEPVSLTEKVNNWFSVTGKNQLDDLISKSGHYAVLLIDNDGNVYLNQEENHIGKLKGLDFSETVVDELQNTIKTVYNTVFFNDDELLVIQNF